MFRTVFLNIENNSSPAPLTLLNEIYTIWHHRTESYKGSVFNSCTKTQACFLATYCKQGLKKSCLQLSIKTAGDEIYDPHRSFRSKTIPLTLCKFNDKFTAVTILSQTFTAVIFLNKYKERKYFNLRLCYWVSEEKKASIFLVSSPVLFVFYKIKKPKIKTSHYHEFVFEAGQLLAEFLGMSSCFALKSHPALPNLAQT